jgi:hypothetical protein
VYLFYRSGFSRYAALSAFIHEVVHVIVLFGVWLIIYEKFVQHQPEVVQRLILTIAMAVGWGIPTVSKLLTRTNAPTLLDLSAARQPIPFWTMLFALAGAIFVFVAMINPEAQFTFLIWGLLWVMLPFNAWAANRTRTLATEEGIFTGRNGYRWTQLRSYHWAHVRGKWRPLVLQIKNRLPLFDVAIISIPLQHVDACEALLVRFVAANRAQAVENTQRI